MRHEQKAALKMDLAIMSMGKKKEYLSKAIMLIKRTGMDDLPEVAKAIEILAIERKRLDKVELF